ncbi:hypothetical protein N7V53_12060 [Kosakonia sp. HypNH10]|uniref:hypothetical protein n=1 Tax=Kosakonia sp. HypNH10 TaxID=2980101 RepID=UPI0024484128|nr:hypothetical protein [Kosakonia sp. HypNH10]MDH2913257.1 hypothetical protein [Kosakonia sp. HypNH10]
MDIPHPILLVTSSLCDFFTPKKELKSPHYDRFISQFSEIAVSAIVSQGNFDEKMFQESVVFLDTHVDEFIDELTDGAMRVRKMFPVSSVILGYDQGELVQNSENRSFVTDYFKTKSRNLEISNRIHVIRTLNASAYFSYFSLFESTIEDIYREIKPNSPAVVTGGIIIEHCLKEILKAKAITNPFYENLHERSKFFINKQVLMHSWGFLNFIRNNQAHSNNQYDENKKLTLEKHYNNIAAAISEEENSESLVDVFHMNFGKIVAQVKDDGFLAFNNTLENFIRHTSLMIMESLYISEYEKLRAESE